MVHINKLAHKLVHKMAHKLAKTSCQSSESHIDTSLNPPQDMYHFDTDDTDFWVIQKSDTDMDFELTNHMNEVMDCRCLSSD